MRPPSPSPSASGSISGFTFETGSASTTSMPSRARPNFWDFEAYSRAVLREKKAIEREKDEWEKNVEERRIILRKSVNFYFDKYEKLKVQLSATVKRLKNLPKVSQIEADLSEKSSNVVKLKSLVNYFGSLKELLKEIVVEKEEEFRIELLKQNWKFGLEKLIFLSKINVEMVDRDTKFCRLSDLKWKIISERINLFNEILSKKIKTYIEGLGWPKIVSNEESAEIISRLQELLTYGEALYLISSESPSPSEDQGKIVHHPMKYFIDPIKMRFNYHFNSDRQTNQLDKPEWYFDNLISTCRENLNFLREFILPCWRLRDLDDFLNDSIVDLSREKTKTSLKSSNMNSSLKVHYLLEFGKFLNCLQDEFGFIKIEGIIEEVFIEDEEEFVECELERIRAEYTKLFLHQSEDDWIPPRGNHQIGEPSPVVLKFLSFFHSSMILPYSFIRNNLKLRSNLLYRVQSWSLEEFHDKCQFECSPLHTSQEDILKDIFMINSFLLISKVLGDDFGESMDYIELSASNELHEIIGHDPSALPGTCFNKATEAFKSLSDRLSSHVFNYVMERFLKPARVYSNSMIYARLDESSSSIHESIPEDLRLAMTTLLDTLNFIQKHLSETQFTKLFKKTLPLKISSFMFQGVLLKNFFTEFGAIKFEEDMKYVQDSLCHVDGITPGLLKEVFSKVSDAIELLKIKERDPTGSFDGARLTRAIRENRNEELKRFLEMKRLQNLKIEELPQIFASRRH